MKAGEAASTVVKVRTVVRTMATAADLQKATATIVTSRATVIMDALLSVVMITTMTSTTEVAIGSSGMAYGSGFMVQTTTPITIAVGYARGPSTLQARIGGTVTITAQAIRGLSLLQKAPLRAGLVLKRAFELHAMRGRQAAARRNTGAPLKPEEVVTCHQESSS